MTFQEGGRGTSRIVLQHGRISHNIARSNLLPHCQFCKPVTPSQFQLMHSLQAAIYFKNCITKRWCLATNEKDPDDPSTVLYSPVNNMEKAEIRRITVRLLQTVEDVISRQLIESIRVSLLLTVPRSDPDGSRGLLHQVALHDAGSHVLL